MKHVPSSEITSGTRSVWLVLTGRAGDVAQVRQLAERLVGAQDGTTVREFTIKHNMLRECPNSWLGPSLRSMASPHVFEAPWPDMVIGIGRRNVSVARWIVKASGGMTKLVWLGRPRIALDHFDLVVSTRQYGVSGADNFVLLPLPFAPVHRASGGFRRLLMLGGDSWSARMTPTYLDRFAELGKAGHGQKLSLITSPRTPEGAAEHLGARLGPDVEIYDWKAAGGQKNPFRQWLSEADTCLLSGDSVSLMSDAVATGRPVTVLPTPKPAWITTLKKTALGRRWLSEAGNWEILAPPPDLDGLYQRLVDTKLAEWRGDTLHFENALPRALEDQSRAVERTRLLLQSDKTSTRLDVMPQSAAIASSA